MPVVRTLRPQTKSINDYIIQVSGMLDPRKKIIAYVAGSGVRRWHLCSNAEYLMTLKAGCHILAAVAYLVQLAFWVLVVVATAVAAGARDSSSNNIGETFYDVLSVSQRSDQAEIKRVFRRLAVRMHPDKLGPFEDEGSERKANDAFVKVSTSNCIAIMKKQSSKRSNAPQCSTVSRAHYSRSALYSAWQTVRQS